MTHFIRFENLQKKRYENPRTKCNFLSIGGNNLKKGGNLLQKSSIQNKNTYQENKEFNIFNDVNLTFIIRIKSFFHIWTVRVVIFNFRDKWILFSFWIQNILKRRKKSSFVNFYRVPHKGWDCKDDLKLFKYDNSKVKLSLLPWR